MQFRTILFMALGAALINQFATAQTPASAPVFVSVYGNFSIALPETPNLTRGLRNVDAPDKGAGMIYAWETENIVYTALYLDPLTDAAGSQAAEELAKSLEESNQNVRDTVKKYGGKIILERPLALGANSGTEIQAALGTGKMIARNFQVGRRGFAVQAVVRDLADGKKALAVLNSFQLIDGKALLRKKIAENMPKPLPPTPRAAIPHSDLFAAKLKGRVKSIFEESEDLTGRDFQQGRIFSAEYFYDANGFLTREITYDTHGNPSQLVNYGFLDKSLVTRFVKIPYPYNAPATAAKKPNEPRYDLKFKYLFDREGRVTEANYRLADGELSSRSLTMYDGDKIETQNFNAKGELISKVVQTFDENGRLSEASFQTPGPPAADYKVMYKYETFDQQGNWTRRIKSVWRTEEGKSFYEPAKIYYRSISYYTDSN
jgi:hypothetical protein